MIDRDLLNFFFYKQRVILIMSFFYSPIIKIDSGSDEEKLIYICDKKFLTTFSLKHFDFGVAEYFFFFMIFEVLSVWSTNTVVADG